MMQSLKTISLYSKTASMKQIKDLTKEDIKEYINTLVDKDEDMLVHILKVCITRKSISDKEILKPLLSAVEKELKKKMKAVVLDN